MSDLKKLNLSGDSQWLQKLALNPVFVNANFCIWHGNNLDLRKTKEVMCMVHAEKGS